MENDKENATLSFVYNYVDYLYEWQKMQKTGKS